MELSFSSEITRCTASQDFPVFIEAQDLLLCSQTPATDSHPKRNIASWYLLMLQDSSQYYFLVCASWNIHT
jgi:hypothetical protein